MNNRLNDPQGELRRILNQFYDQEKEKNRLEKDDFYKFTQLGF